MAQRHQPTVQAGLRGPDRHTEGGGNFRQWEIEVVVEGDDNSLVSVEATETTLDFVMGRRRHGGVAHHRVGVS